MHSLIFVAILKAVRFIAQVWRLLKNKNACLSNSDHKEEVFAF